MSKLAKLTVLHSNDMHGDFHPILQDGVQVGGVPLLSGYVDMVRRQEENVIYAICGDMFRGSLIDQEFKGLSTIEIVNLLEPDVVTLGNHEVDYGISHLLFVEKCARFPIINANMYINLNHVRLFKSHIILNIGNMSILCIGILTEEVLHQTRMDKMVGSLVDIDEAAREVGRLCNAYRSEDIDFTILLTHIGFDEDKELAAKLEPEWGVDLIIGGHSHTRIEEAAVVNGIPIAQAASGTDQIGRFDLVIDTENNRLESFTWELVPIDSTHCPVDKDLQALIDKYQSQTDAIYARIVTRFEEPFLHPVRNTETSLGNLISDIFQQSLQLDMMLTASGSIRGTSLGPIVEYQTLLELYPFNDPIYRVMVSGKQLRTMMHYMLRDEVLDGDGHYEFYQPSQGVQVVYSRSSHTIESFTLHGQDIIDDQLYSVGMHEYHLKGIGDFLQVPLEEIEQNKKPKIVATNSVDILEEYLSHTEQLKPWPLERLVIID